MNSVVKIDSLKHRLHQSYGEFERRLEEQAEPERPSFKKVNKKLVSTTDPEAAFARDGGTKLSYKIHRGVDGANEVITATRTTPGDTHESHVLQALLDDHQANTEEGIETVVADAQYGTVENLLACHDRGIATHMPHLGKAAQKRNAARGIFGIDRFQYDSGKDVYICPSGNELKRLRYDPQNRHIVYKAANKSCRACQLRDQCTKSKNARTIRRHERQTSLDKKHSEGKSRQGRHDIRTRQHLMERSFAKAKRYGFDRARWRGLWRMEIQELMTCIVQNIQVLASKTHSPPKTEAVKGSQGIRKAQSTAIRLTKWIYGRFKCVWENHLAVAPI